MASKALSFLGAFAMASSAALDVHPYLARAHAARQPTPTDNVTPLYVLGERNSGTNWVVGLLRSNLQHPIQVRDCFCSFKHFFQLPCANQEPGLIVIVTRNIYDWLSSFHAKPYNSPAHHDLTFKQFLSQPWALTEPNAPHGPSYLDATTPACGRNQRPQLIRVSHDQILRPRSGVYRLTPCQVEKGLIEEPWQEQLPQIFCGKVPAYELDENYEPFASIIEMRSAKLRSYLELSNWTGYPVEYVTYDNLIDNFPDNLERWINHLGRRYSHWNVKVRNSKHIDTGQSQYKLTPEGEELPPGYMDLHHEAQFYVRRCLPVDGVWSNKILSQILDRADWATERRLGYEAIMPHISQCPNKTKGWTPASFDG